MKTKQFHQFFSYKIRIEFIRPLNINIKIDFLHSVESIYM